MLLLMHHEDCFLTAKQCDAGVLTIGFGHTTTFGNPKVVPGMRISYPDAVILLYKDTMKVYDGINPTVSPLDYLQQASLVSFAYNIGVDSFNKSTVAERLRDWRGPPDNLWQFECLEMHLLRWDKIGNTVAPGLVKRRKEEAWILLWQQHLIRNVVKVVPFVNMIVRRA
jgi:lysozyme